jgi:hypothetical protein
MKALFFCRKDDLYIKISMAPDPPPGGGEDPPKPIPPAPK